MGDIVGLVPFRGVRIRYYLSPQAVRKLKIRTIIKWFIFGMGLLPAILGLLPSTSNAGTVLILPGVLLVLISGGLARAWRMPVRAWKIEDARIWIAGIPAPVRNAIVQMEQALANQRARHDHPTGTPPL
ncbi:MAG: hypothetical protein JWM59_4799 [Verrucomicrobiales bacterium]|nr:hypothetical protein [Verrucomicrobiales bacterium]